MPFIEKLIEMGWKKEQFVFQPEWQVPATPSEASKREKGVSFKGFPVDIAIFDSPSHVGDYRHLDIIVETKKPNSKEGIAQLEIYMSLEPHVKLGIWTNGKDISTVQRNIKGELVPKALGRIPYPHESLTEGAAKTLYWDDLEKNVPNSTLSMVFYDLLCAIVSEDTISTRSEERLDNICNILLAKIESDKIAKYNSSKPVRFQLAKTTAETATNIKQLFADILTTHADAFENEDARIKFDDRTIEKIVYELAKYSLYGLPVETVSTAFQVFRQANLKSDDGQYFTPLPVIQNAVKLLEVKPEDKVLDPACGSGGFLLESYLSLRHNYPGMDEADAKGWAQRHLYGVDKDSINIKLTKAIMLTIGDGSTNTCHGDTIRKNEWESKFPSLAINLKDSSFHCILTNPPFGKNIKLSANDGLLNKYALSHKSLSGGQYLDLSKEIYTERELGIVFIEQCYNLLMPGGKLGILLPETYMFSNSYKWLQNWIYEHFYFRGIVNIPMEAFQGFCRAKTNLYIFEKKGKSKSSLSWVRENKVLVVNSKTCGINKDGNELYVVDKETGERDYSKTDNQMSDDCDSVLSGLHSKNVMFVDSKKVEESKVAVPIYYCNHEFEEDVEEFCKHFDFELKTLGQLSESRMIEFFSGHGSPSADQRIGDVPYIKVSDLRAGRLNINSTNMIPLSLAKKFWKKDQSGLKAFDLLSPERASKNIGEFCLLLPGQEQVVLTKEIIGLRSNTDLFDQFYLMWVMNLPFVRNQWNRVVFMQTNREDVGKRYLEIKVPVPLKKEVAKKISKPYKEYFDSLNEINEKLTSSLKEVAKNYQISE